MNEQKIDVYVLETEEYSDDYNKFGESFRYRAYFDVMSYSELVIFCAKNHLNWLKTPGVIKDNAGFIKYFVTTKTIEEFWEKQ